MSEQLDQALKSHLAKNKLLPKLVILGIGNEINGDDAAGVLIVQTLKKAISNSDQVILIDASIAPENFTGEIRDFCPDWIWIFDAAGLDRHPGTLQLIDLDSVASQGANTHRIAPTMFLSYLQLELNFQTFFFGIQPNSVDPFSEVSLPVKRTIQITTNY
ncbi:MAG TPA: hydrogenase maturation protease, partial [Anaerolineaceae bacterium]|nr:hydrogenase maturation protease [Anaerolineaceae bacterium]